MNAQPSYGAGAASAARIRDAIHTGAIKLAPAPQRFGPMTADRFRLDSGIPTLTERHAARHHRNAPHLHLVHRVDTERDLPDGVAGVAIGHTALPEGCDDSVDDELGGDLYEAVPLTAADRRFRSKVWRAIVAAYVIGIAWAAWAWLGA
jgi:hypothetical protein